MSAATGSSANHGRRERQEKKTCKQLTREEQVTTLMGSACVCVWQGKGCVWEETADFRKRAAVLAQLSSILSRGGKILKHHKKTSLFINPKPNWTLGSGFLTTKAQIYRALKAPRRPELMNKWKCKKKVWEDNKANISQWGRSFNRFFPPEELEECTWTQHAWHGPESS